MNLNQDNSIMFNHYHRIDFIYLNHSFLILGTTITLQNPSTSTILAPAPISTMISAASVQPSSVSIPMTLANEQILVQSSSTTKPTQSHPKKRKHK